MNTKKPEATQVLDDLLKMSNAEIRQLLWTAREYSDHASVRGTGIAAGDRLLRQIRLARAELSK